MNSMNTTPLDGVFCWPCPLLSFSIFDEPIAKKYINAFEKSGTEESLFYLAKRVVPEEKKTIDYVCKKWKSLPISPMLYTPFTELVHDGGPYHIETNPMICSW